MPVSLPDPVNLTSAIAKLNENGALKVYTEEKLPPRLPSPYKRWSPAQAEDAPHDSSSYWPMVLYK